MPIETREKWLQQMVDKLAPLFKAAEAPLPEVRVSCGWPSVKAMARRHRAVGQCWPTSASKAGVNEIFISPICHDPLQIGAILVHELVHAVDDCANQHKGRFAKLARKVGLVGKMTQSNPGDELAHRIQEISQKLGPYPHRELDKSALDGKKKAGSRLIKVMCPEPDCGVVIRMCRNYIEDGMIPVCACGVQMEEAS